MLAKRLKNGTFHKKPLTKITITFGSRLLFNFYDALIISCMQNVIYDSIKMEPASRFQDSFSSVTLAFGICSWNYRTPYILPMLCLSKLARFGDIQSRRIQSWIQCCGRQQETNSMSFTELIRCFTSYQPFSRTFKAIKYL